MTTATISRRGFTTVLGTGAGYALLRPTTTLAGGARAAQDIIVRPRTGPTTVRLSSNENPHGPSPAAFKAMTDAFGLAWRYPDEHADSLITELASLNGVSGNQILLGAGSGEILKLCAVAFTNQDKKLVIGNPTFEAIGHHASVARAQVVKIDLTADYSHDLPKMLSAAADAGLVYICNPNNPTASITQKNEMRSFLSRLSPQTMVLVDEAYHHYVESADYESVIPLVATYPNLIVARTFSKIYGMAGLRCGYCVTRGENIWKLRSHQAFDSVSIMALAAALASLKDSDHVTQGRRSNSENKKAVCAELDKLGYHYIPSHANFMMIDVRRDVRPVISSMRQRGVEVGRPFAPLPNFMRVTIGTESQMTSFLSAFREVMA